FLPQPPGAKNDTSLPDGDAQVRHRNLPRLRRGRTAEVRNLVSTENGPQEDIAHASLRQMHDLRVHRIGTMRLFGLELRAHAAAEIGIGVTEPSVSLRAGRSGDV